MYTDIYMIWTRILCCDSLLLRGAFLKNISVIRTLYHHHHMITYRRGFDSWFSLFKRCIRQETKGGTHLCLVPHITRRQFLFYIVNLNLLAALRIIALPPFLVRVYTVGTAPKLLYRYHQTTAPVSTSPPNTNVPRSVQTHVKRESLLLDRILTIILAST